MPGNLLFDVCESLQARCRADRQVLADAIRDMVLYRWTDNDIGMHVACHLPRASTFPTCDARRFAVINDITRRCLEDDEALRVTISTDVGGWTDEELSQYAGQYLRASPPNPGLSIS